MNRLLTVIGHAPLTTLRKRNSVERAELEQKLGEPHVQLARRTSAGDIGSINGLTPGPTGEMITMARQQLIKSPKPPRQPSPPDLRTPSGRLLPY
ncbi:hypothetical protein [Actinomadura terrae]|uniref:hypothetical protein n=1 Tax=Actinomadura terrae TaxID=604353 RepID=UPI001FA74ADC|nr:hypothetical protein [Actinomadura terrae]